MHAPYRHMLVQSVQSPIAKVFMQSMQCSLLHPAAVQLVKGRRMQPCSEKKKESGRAPLGSNKGSDMFYIDFFRATPSDPLCDGLLREVPGGAPHAYLNNISKGSTTQGA